jgi:RNA polymerase sigma factor (sigma-70 family)
VSAVAPALGHAPQPRPADATGLLYERYHRRIFGFCLGQLGSREDAEDAVQTTFVNAQRGLRRGVVPQFELAWLFTIARNVCHNSRDSASRRGRLETVRDLEDMQDTLAMPERGSGISVGELTRALGKIPERQRRALLLREFQGLSYDEISKELAVSLSAVETLIFRARRSVAEQVERTGTSWRGAAAWMVTGFRWLVGGAAPLKVAAVTAAVATTATLAVVPAVRDDGRAPTPAPAQNETSRPVVRTPDAVRRATPGPAPAAKPRPASGEKGAPARADQVHVATPPVRTEAAPRQTSSPRSDQGTSVTPTLNIPSVTVPPLSTPELNLPAPDVTLPQVSLPAVQLPSVPLPLDPPQLPALPALP